MSGYLLIVKLNLKNPTIREKDEYERERTQYIVNYTLYKYIDIYIIIDTFFTFFVSVWFNFTDTLSLYNHEPSL